MTSKQTGKNRYKFVFGDKEMADGTVNVRRYGSKATEVQTIDAFVDTILADIARKSRVEKEDK